MSRKTMWNGYAVNRTPQGMMDKYKCSACESKCFLVIPITEEPPNLCIKDANLCKTEVEYAEV